MATKCDTLIKRRAGMRTQTTKLFSKIDKTLSDDSISVEEKFDLLNICKDQLNEKYDI